MVVAFPWRRQVLDAPAALLTNGLRIQGHELEDFLGHIDADRQAEFLRLCSKDRVVMRPCSSRKLFGELFGLVGGTAVAQQLLRGSLHPVRWPYVPHRP